MAMVAQSSDYETNEQNMLETELLRRQANHWWQIVSPYADRCFELAQTASQMKTPEQRADLSRELAFTVETVAALPCPIPLTTARRQLLAALDTLIVSFDHAARGDCEAARAHTRTAIGHLRRLAGTLDAFGVGA